MCKDERKGNKAKRLPNVKRELVCEGAARRVCKRRSLMLVVQCVSVILFFEGLTWEDCEFETNLGHIMRPFVRINKSHTPDV